MEARSPSVTFGDADFVGCTFPDDSGSSTASMYVWKLPDSIGGSGVSVVASNTSTHPCVCDIPSFRGAWIEASKPTETDSSETTSFILGLRGLKIGASALSDEHVVT
jgi:hypothetical protein